MNKIKSYRIISGVMSIILLSSCSFEKKEGLKKIEAIYGPNRVNISKSKADVKLEKINLPDNFKIEVWAADIPQARSLAKTEDGIVFVGNRSNGKVFAIIDADADGKADYRYTIAEGLHEPNGVAYRNGNLYVAERQRILEFPDIKNNITHPKYKVIYDKFPNSIEHGHKFIRFGPDGLLYVPVGAPCNICLSEDKIFASLTRINVESENIEPEIIAYGIRNTVGFDWNPVDKNLWFTDNDRDLMGDDIPSCELNQVKKIGEHFGFPYLHAENIKDPEFGDQKPDSITITTPEVKLGAHVAPLGMRFYQGKMFPEKYYNNIFIAEHGSWNRSKKVGYSIVFVEPGNNNQESKKSKFITGWLNNSTQEVWGRPVDIMELTDGSLLISDDYADCIYRVTYN